MLGYGMVNQLSKYPILCKVEIGFQDLKEEIVILCNQENASETHVGGSNEGGATNQPQNAKEAR